MSLQLLREDYLEHRTLYEAVQSIVSERARQHPVAILDLGCGDSDYVARMLEAAGGGDTVQSYTGVDLSEPAMAISMCNIERWVHDALCHSLLHMDHALAWNPLCLLLADERPSRGVQPWCQAPATCTQACSRACLDWRMPFESTVCPVACNVNSGWPCRALGGTAKARWHHSDFVDFSHGCQDDSDIILMSFALHHLNEAGKGALLKQAHRLLKSRCIYAGIASAKVAIGVPDLRRHACKGPHEDCMAPVVLCHRRAAQLVHIGSRS